MFYHWIRKNVRRAIEWLPAHVWACYCCYMARQRRRLVRGVYFSRGSRSHAEGHRAICVYDLRFLRIGRGWAERLQGMLSVYGLCKAHGWKFGIWFKTPFVLEDFLLPNGYDWRVSEADLDLPHAAPIICAWLNGANERFGRRYLEERMGRQAVGHLYTNIDVLSADERAWELFDELFRPAPRLEALVEEHTRAMGGSYVAAAFRFLKLLGDFNEVSPFPTLREAQREALIVACLAQLERVRADHSEAPRVLVTADSPTFLARAAAAFDWVYVVEGRVGHIDAGEGVDDSVTIKMLLDFYLLARAASVRLVVGPGMYRSGFSRTAARVGNVPFEQWIFR